jgi:UDP-glucose 4-epimerase
VRALENQGGKTTAFNLGTRRGYSVKEVLDVVEAATGSRPVRRSAPRRRTSLHRTRSTKGTIRFPLSEPVPVKLIERIAKFRAKEAADREKAKAAAPKKR